MANRVTEVGRLLRAGESELARRRVRKAIERAKGNATAAARLLNVDGNTIWRWIDRLALENVVKEARASAGRHPGHGGWWGRVARAQARGQEGVHPGGHAETP